MTIDIESLSLRELGALVVAAEQRKQLVSSRRPASAVRRLLKAAAAEAGYTIEELFGNEATETAAPARKSPRRKSGKVAAKYRDSEYKRLTWSGRGRMPRWLTARIQQGHKATDFLIPGLAKPTARKSSTIGKRTVVKKD
ncbi:H-NS histone family protein [Stenotrophomonas sp. 24(2023)]|uniref:H-NS histone family protein n=1 Tax=Stenotrophomonas sp. 24(2023) TaxID=3068324 RepID=UPI0027E20C60|nr:H-NS histone family protein [Stenotrophomonas sp. 24(2023)]WMJ70627.1 H-NS histone family protein [Stenotrophomonas sp. 24(2023)]